MNSKIALIVFVMTLSALFPLAGYYLDFKIWKKRRTRVEESGKLNTDESKAE